MFRITRHGLGIWILATGIALLGGYASANTGTVTMVSDDVFLVPKTKQMWRADLSKRITNKDGVEQYLDLLNSGEYSDWRLPDKRELKTLFDTFDIYGHGDVDIRLEMLYWLAGDNGAPPYVGTWEPGGG